MTINSIVMQGDNTAPIVPHCNFYISYFMQHVIHVYVVRVPRYFTGHHLVKEKSEYMYYINEGVYGSLGDVKFGKQFIPFPLKVQQTLSYENNHALKEKGGAETAQGWSRFHVHRMAPI